MLDSDAEDIKIERPVMTDSQKKHVEKSIASAMDLARQTAKELDDISKLDYSSLEIILRVAQRAISDLKEIRQKQSYQQSLAMQATMSGG